jgi:hypothetical protein
MTGSSVDHGSHIDDGDLVRLLDGECSAAEREQLDDHIAVCPDCKTNADSLQRASALFSKSALELDAREPERSKPELSLGRRYARRQTQFSFLSVRVLRAAAVLALMIVAFTATPARAWLVQGWESLVSLVRSETPEVPEVPAVPEQASATVSSILRFSPRGSQFRLEFMSWQAGGTLVLQLDSAATASAGIVGEEGNEEMILLPNGLRVRNSDGSSTSYEVRLPLSLSVIEVSIAGSTLLRLDVQSESGPSRRELSLSGESEE